MHGLLTGGRIQIGGRLVGQQQAGAVGNRPRYGHPLGFTAGKFVGKRRRGGRKTDPIEKFADASGLGVTRHTVQDQRECDVLGNRQIGKQVAPLKDESHRPAQKTAQFPRTECINRRPEAADFSAVGRFQPANTVQQG